MVGNAMDGVGEDERPYNYICNLDKVNLGGPGWFNDVFKVRAETFEDWVIGQNVKSRCRSSISLHNPS